MGVSCIPAAVEPKNFGIYFRVVKHWGDTAGDFTQKERKIKTKHRFSEHMAQFNAAQIT